MIAIRRTTWDNLTVRHRRIVRWISDQLELGEPAIWTDGTRDQYVWDDPRITLLQVAVLGCLAANLTDIPAGYDPTGKTRAQIRDDIRTWIASKLVRPDQITYSGPFADRWAETLVANGAPVTIRAGQIPAGWTPKPSPVLG